MFIERIQYPSMQAPIRLELPTMYGMKSVNAYLLLDPIPTLIDCGEKTDKSWKVLQQQLQQQGLQVKDIQRLIITHAHVDHIGMAGKIAENSDAEVWVNEYCYPWAVQKELMWDRRIKLMSKLLPPSASFRDMVLGFMKEVSNHWDNIPKERVRVFPMNGQLVMGGMVWEIIYVPGHANMQTCFYQADQKWLISADMLLRITPTAVMDASIEDPTKRDKGLKDLLASYQKIASLDIAKVFPGHYEIFENAHETIEFQVARIHSRIEECFELIQNGKQEFMEILHTMYANRIHMPAFAMLIGYLDILLEEGRIEEVKLENGKRGYAVK